MKRELWIDVLRGIAIVAVVVDHWIYLNPYYSFYYIIQAHLTFSVVFFVFLSGVSNGFSAQKKDWKIPSSFYRFWIKKIPFLLTFIFASLVSTFYYMINRQNINVQNILVDVWYFSGQPPYYYLVIIFKLYIIFPFLYSLFIILPRKAHLLLFAGMVGLLYLIRFLPTHRWYSLLFSWPFSEGYLFIFLFGIYYSLLNFQWSWVKRFLCISLLVLFEVIIWYYYNGFIRAIPSDLFLVWAISLLFTTKMAADLLNDHTKIGSYLAFLGRNSYIIFLFHYLILQSMVRLTSSIGFMPSIVLAIFMPVFLGYSLNKFRERMRIFLQTIIKVKRK